MDKFFVSKAVAIGYNIIKNSDCVNLNLENDGYNRYFGKVCFEWLKNEMLAIEDYMKENF